MLISARSISFRATGILYRGVRGRVLASFERACDLITDGGAVVALVWCGVGDGPPNIVLEREPGIALPVGTRFAVAGQSKATPGGTAGAMQPISDERRLLFPGSGGDATPLQIRLSSAVPWDPRPDWEALRLREERITAAAAALREALATDIGPYLKEEPAGASSLNEIGPDAIGRAGTAVLDAFRDDDRDALATAISALCGLGPGLTPAGDDWLAGWLLGLHLAPDLTGLGDVSGLVLQIARHRTTTLSRAFLECAAAGEADAAWHALLAALADETAEGRVRECAHAVLSHGATSGAAMLAGFLDTIALDSPRHVCYKLAAATPPL